MVGYFYPNLGQVRTNPIKNVQLKVGLKF